MRRVIPAVILLFIAAAAFFLSVDENISADTQSYYIVNPSATSNVNGNTGSRGLQSTDVKGHTFPLILTPVSVFTPGAPWPVNVQTPISVFTPGALWPVVQLTPAPTAAPSEVTPAAMVIIAPTSVPTAFGTPQFPAVAAGLKTSTVQNTTDQSLYCSLAGSITPIAEVPANSSWTENWASRGQKLSGAIGCIHPSSTPSTGQVTIFGNN